MAKVTELRTRQKHLRQDIESPGIYDWKITFHKKTTKKEQGELSPIMLLCTNYDEVKRRLWRLEHIEGLRQQKMRFKVWKFSREGWQEIDDS